ncbi:MAG: hypothetical protein LUO93_00105 [Methanomicrobiales archaeon]|nr:hypothetical protein [Methanomicrobiales archaeon]
MHCTLRINGEEPSRLSIACAGQFTTQTPQDRQRRGSITGRTAARVWGGGEEEFRHVAKAVGIGWKEIGASDILQVFPQNLDLVQTSRSHVSLRCGLDTGDVEGIESH